MGENTVWLGLDTGRSIWVMIGDNIGLVKAKLGLTVRKIGDATEMTGASISRFINGKAIPSEEWVDRFCEVYHIEKEWLTGGEGEPGYTLPVANPEKNCGERLREMRKELGLRQRDIYEKLGITSSTYTRIENGRINLTEKNAKKIEEIYGVGADWLLCGDEERKEYPVSERMIEYLWENEEERKKLWEKMRPT